MPEPYKSAYIDEYGTDPDAATPDQFHFE